MKTVQQSSTKKRTCQIVDFNILADHCVKIKESKKRDKYLDFAKELKKLLNKNVMVRLIVVGALGTISKETGRLRIRGQAETI